MQNVAKLKPITNRSAEGANTLFTLPEDGFVMLVPRGEAPNFIGEGETAQRIIQVVDDAALEAMYSKLLNREGEEILMDDDHLSHELDQPTDANAWLLLNKDTLQIRADGLYGKPRWTQPGEGKVLGGVKRFISAEFSPRSIVPLGGVRFRVTELTGLALTNRPNFKRLQKPLTNRDADEGIKTANTNTMHKEALAAHLGITTSALEALDESTLNNRLKVIKDQAAKADGYETELNTIKNREADTFLEQNKEFIPAGDSFKKMVKDAYLANRESAQVMVDGFKEFKGAAATGDKGLTEEQKRRAETKPLFNRDQAKGPADAATAEAAASARASKVATRAQEICNREKVTWQTAWARASAEITA